MDQFIKEFILKSWGSQSDMFPGPQPVSIERKHIPLLKQNLYCVFEKTDGVRHLLVCVQFGQKKVCALVDRLFNIRHIRAAVPVNTLLDGELLNDTYHVYDAMVIQGENVMNESLNNRLEKARGILKGPSLGIKMSVKRMRFLCDFDDMVKETAGDPNVDGFIFTPVKEPVRTGTHETMFKWKPLEKITIDFLCKENGLYIWDKRMGFLKVQNFTASEHEDGKIIECRLEGGSWQFLKIRGDKDHPNNRRTYLRTLVNIRECVDLKEFYH